MDTRLNDEKDLEHNVEVEPKIGKKRKHKDKKNKHGIDKVINLNEVLEENCMGITQTCSNEGDFTFLRNGEEENNKSERKKRKKGSDSNEIISSITTSDIEVQFLDDKQERKTKKRKNCGDLTSGMQESDAVNYSNKSKGTKDSKFESNEGGSSFARVKIGDANTCSVAIDNDVQDKKMKKKKMKKKKKLSSKNNRVEDSEFRSNGGDPALAESDEGDLHLVNINMRNSSERDIATEVDDQGEKKKKKEKKKKNKEDKRVTFSDQVEAFNDGLVRGKRITPEEDEKIKEAAYSKKKKKMEKKNKSKEDKRVTFSDQVEVFNDGLVRGKRFTLEEDAKIKEAVYNYIESRGLGDEGLDMVLHCRHHREVRDCWKEIGLALPHRPHVSVYERAHVLFERDDSHKWAPEEYEFIRKFHENHGPKWKMLAEAMGKHRFHVKDAWRRIKLSNTNKGRWTQEEYQKLFDLVNTDLRLRALEDHRRLKYGMLRDNICWEAIGQKLATRTSQFCCMKWYEQLSSPMVAEGEWSDTDDYRLLNALFTLDACSMEEVDWDNLLGHRSGDFCRKRWNQMVQHVGEHGNKSFAEQVEVLSRRYCPHLLETREAFDNKPVVP